MRKLTLWTALLCFAGLQSVWAEKTFINTQNYAADSDVVLEGAVEAVKKAPQDTVDMIGDAVKFAADEAVTAAKGVAAAFKSDPVAPVKKEALMQVGKAWSPDSGEIIFRSYRISDSVGHDLVPDGQRGVVDVSGSFAGVPFPKGTSAYYRREFQRLFIRQTLENMLLIEDILAGRHKVDRNLAGHLVEIETKFIEVSQTTLNDLGFNWRFDSKNSGGNPDAQIFRDLVLPSGQDLLSAGLRTAAGAFPGGSDPGTLLAQKTAGSLRWSMIISALEQADDSDMLSAQRVVTRDRRTATLHAGREQMMPKRLAARSGNTSTYVEHSAWGKELIGVQLEVTPELRGNGLIDLSLKPKVLDHAGFDHYHTAPQATFQPYQGWGRAHSWGSTSQNNVDSFIPLVTRGIDALGNVYTNTLGRLYEAITSTTSFLGGDGGAYMHANLPGAGVDPATTPLNRNKPDANDFTLHHVGAGGIFAYHDRTRLGPEDMTLVPRLGGYLPNYHIREMQTKVTVEDGGTVGMGGLVYDKLETYRDKVPVLGSIPLVGRLFRSEGEHSIKRNLLIFVSASQLDIHGRRTADLALSK